MKRSSEVYSLNRREMQTRSAKAPAFLVFLRNSHLILVIKRKNEANKKKTTKQLTI